MTANEVPGQGSILRSNLMSLVTPLIVLYILCSLAFRVKRAFFGPLSHFPGPKVRALSILPSIRTTWRGEDNSVVPALHERYGKVVRVAPNQLSFVGDGDIWKDIHGFRKPGQPEVAKCPLFYRQNPGRAPSLISATDPVTHARQRKAVSHAFSDRALREQEPVLKMWADRLRLKLGEHARNPEGTDVLKMLNCATFDIMADLTFAEPLYMLDYSEYAPWVKTIFGGIKYGTRIRALRMLHPFCKWFLGELVSRVPLRRRAIEHWKHTCDRVDRRLAETPDRPDLWTRIIEKSDNFTMLSRREHYSIASLFMVAGTETTATLLSGATYHLLSNPTYLHRLTTDLRTTFSSPDGDDVKLDPLARIPFLDAVLRESLRMHPPVPIGLPRIAPPGGLQVGDHFVPAGTLISIHQLSTYRHPDNFRDADKFRPERWLGDPRFKDDNLDAFEPFSVGPRNCLGKNLAWHEMRLLLATVLLHFDLELCERSRAWADQKVYTLWDKPPLMCRLTEVARAGPGRGTVEVEVEER